jgi:L-lactate dehydrogenase
MENKKVVVIGDGAVGSTTAYTLMQHSYINEIVIVDLNKNKAEGDVLDMIHGLSFVSQKVIKAGDYSDIKGAKVVIITAGAAQKEGETRLDLLKKNIKVFDSIIESIKPYLDENSIILVVTNPVDVLSYYTYKKLGISANRVIGSGTVLDSSRLKTLLSEDTKIDPRNIHAYVIGEHGDSEVCAFSVSSIGGVSVKDYCASCGKCDMRKLQNLSNIASEVVSAAYQIIQKKGATFYAIALSVEKIVDTILNNQHSVLTISSYITNAFDGEVDGVYLSLPTVVGGSGVEKILNLNYSYDEVIKLIASAKTLKSTYKDLEINE